MGFLKKRKLIAPVVEAPQEEVVEEVEEVEEQVERVVENAVHINPARIQSDIARMLKFTTFEPEQRYWLDTGNADLNSVLGSRERGIPYGKIIELSGKESAGKTAITNVIAGMAQRDGAVVGDIDLEDSRDEKWSAKLGLDFSQVIQIYPKLISKKKGTPVLESAELLFQEAETAMEILSSKGVKKQFWFLDSVANIQTEMVIEAGTTDQNMRTKLDRAMFLSLTLPRWAGLAANYNAMIILINQLRDKQGMVFGKPTYTPGGRALRHACAIRAEVIPVKGGVLKNGEKQIGIVGKIKNEKNKAGEGSEPNMVVGFKIKWASNPARVTFMPLEEATA